MVKRLTFQDLKESAKNDPDEYQEFVDIELENLKKQQMFYHSTPVDQRREIMKNNVNVRKEVKKLLKNEDDINKFMYAKDWESYQKKLNSKRFEKIADNLKKPMTPDTFRSQSVNPEPPQAEKNLQNINKNRKGLDTIVYYNEDAIRASRQKMNEKKVPEFLEENYKPKPDPDVSRGLGAILKVNKSGV